MKNEPTADGEEQAEWAIPECPELSHLKKLSQLVLPTLRGRWRNSNLFGPAVIRDSRLLGCPRFLESPLSFIRSTHGHQ
jgi:hypothetical protein